MAVNVPPSIVLISSRARSRLGVAMPRLAFGKACEGGPGAADMLVWQEAIGPAADDVFDGLVSRSPFLAARPIASLGSRVSRTSASDHERAGSEPVSRVLGAGRGMIGG
jgi:hypothetical protein